MIQIDGTHGEGGGQILRSSLTLSLLTGRPFTISNIRGGRSRPGLLRQHRCAVQAAARIGGAQVEGDSLGSAGVVFAPAGVVTGGEYRFAVGSAGSAMLVLQTILLPLLSADRPSRVVLEGGTHNPWAPPTPFLQASFLPVLRSMGAEVTLTLLRPGFFPAGGGRVVLEVSPCTLAPVDVLRGPLELVRAIATVAGVPDTVARREIKTMVGHLRHLPEPPVPQIETYEDSLSPGNLARVEILHGGHTACFVAFGERRRRAEQVGRSAAQAAMAWLDSGASVCEHLADQLLLPMAWAGGGSFSTDVLSEHTRTNVHTIAQFMDVPVRLDEADDRIDVTVGGG